MDKKTFAYVWEYTVKSEFRDEFIKTYRPDGEWAKLFGNANGYIKTDLFHDVFDPNRFVTVDYWRSKSDRDTFQIQFSEEYKRLDEFCEKFTEREKLLGEFEEYASPSQIKR